MNVSMAIAVRDEPEEWRKKQGDIIAIMPSGHQWGTGEVLNHLILELQLPVQISFDKVRWLNSPRYSSGNLNVMGAEPIAKRHFKVDWNTLKTVVAGLGVTVDWTKVEDVTQAYQPLSEQNAAPGGTIRLLNPLQIIYDKHVGRIIKAADAANWVG